jgi:hypothetical protein
MGWGTGYRLGPDFVPPLDATESEFEITANNNTPPRQLPPPIARFVSMVRRAGQSGLRAPRFESRPSKSTIHGCFPTPAE